MEIGLTLELFNTMMVATGVMAGVYFMMKYLQRGEGASSSKEASMLRAELKEIRNRIAYESLPSRDDVALLKAELEKIRKDQALISDDKRNNIINSLAERIKEESASSILEEIQEKISKEGQNRTRIEVIENQFSQTIDRLKKELFSLSKRGNLNLSIGIVTTIAGLALLGMFVLGESPAGTAASTEQFVIDFIPRISLVVLIEVFAYFFLRLYKANLSEIKYFQNEITTIESKYLALKVAVNLDEPDQLKIVIDRLSNTERNFILDKGQSTVDLERARIEQQTSTDVLGKITTLLSKAPNK
jgi:hypothetical protein